MVSALLCEFMSAESYNHMESCPDPVPQQYSLECVAILLNFFALFKLSRILFRAHDCEHEADHVQGDRVMRCGPSTINQDLFGFVFQRLISSVVRG